MMLHVRIFAPAALVAACAYPAVPLPEYRMCSGTGVLNAGYWTAARAPGWTDDEPTTAPRRASTLVEEKKVRLGTPVPPNDSCLNALLAEMNATTVVDTTAATEDPGDPGFCCHGGPACPGGECVQNPPPSQPTEGLCERGLRDGESCDPTLGPDSQAKGTVWFKFVATEDSARIHTCKTGPPIDDSLIQAEAFQNRFDR